MKKWLLSLLGFDLLPIIGLLVVLGGTALIAAYATGRGEGSALCNAAALEIENTQLRKDIETMRSVSTAAVDRAVIDAAAISLLRDQVEDLEHAFSDSGSACRLTPDDARRLREIR